ncbi:TorF family putative porin [Verminephrobacter aporrectodeae]|uniref:Uncharacterized protein n=1 Tax=Verminephrobacter aporrectodeae subsp. tuberculatae TaxID=1110392 RepID=A0ABT3KZ56_9BURK|nr:TorF family putative porin [Verminephrobacter aporrectodeae]MCW5222187.1 hypothetical protein [Verminephrobacter aporrectodeae subsp. tuberculatae]MCW5257614.1 hypothetical protein [Verminephrobacter aporrectodeae subsp. tuberculatae]MCW5287651.1 hypothetical protein [Verminephrobacter aporrectodeae subsp. tuberculatae]MCW5323604.1 hypothetical protein [Verminephrobacter aporrectodeae subsp. tuberculatae]MCW8166878.1 hypothetical protein [Verminephrobacter aporrectodeae subsp. tuberculatae]
MLPCPIKSQGLAFLALLALALPAHAELSGNISLTSNYKFRGQDQNVSKNKPFKPAIQGGLDYSFGESGFYVGNWNSSVKWLPGNSIETDLYGGYKLKAGGADLDVGLMAYVYPGNSSGNTFETYGGATFGPFSAKYSHTLSRDYFGFAGVGLRGRNTGYLNLACAQEIAPRFTLRTALGWTRFGGSISAPNYIDYSLGGAYDFGSGLSLGAALVGANKKYFFGPVNKSRVLATLTKTL